MNQPQVFNHYIFGDLPVIIVNGVEWFGTTEAAKALSFGNPYDAIKNHIEEDDLAVHEVIDSLGRAQQKKFTNESGLYSLIFGAAKQGNNPEIQNKAREFKRWVTSEVLPTIRQHGAYLTPAKLEEVLLNPDTIIDLAQRLKQANEEKAKLVAKIESDKPKVLFAEALETSGNSILIGELAKLLKQNGIEIGQNRLFERLRNEGYLMRTKDERWNDPTQKALELGLFEIKKRTINSPDGSVRTVKTTKVTGKGQIYFINKYKAGVAS
ncbi:phage antirepressor [Paenibacillus naphthalenovorans]|uniref:phage antirepressor n=1 Tax=Paenibacillus naphthalenovorans TaxID=162209 RepID=UPI003D2E694C